MKKITLVLPAILCYSPLWASTLETDLEVFKKPQSHTGMKGLSEDVIRHNILPFMDQMSLSNYALTQQEALEKTCLERIRRAETTPLKIDLTKSKIEFTPGAGLRVSFKDKKSAFFISLLRQAKNLKKEVSLEVTADSVFQLRTLLPHCSAVNSLKIGFDRTNELNRKALMDDYYEPTRTLLVPKWIVSLEDWVQSWFPSSKQEQEDKIFRSKQTKGLHRFAAGITHSRKLQESFITNLLTYFPEQNVLTSLILEKDLVSENGEKAIKESQKFSKLKEFTLKPIFKKDLKK